nr:MAG TPA: spore coat protein [Caudoviricetes sp.]
MTKDDILCLLVTLKGCCGNSGSFFVLLCKRYDVILI